MIISLISYVKILLYVDLCFFLSPLLGGFESCGLLETVAIGLFVHVLASLFVGKQQLTYPPINALVYGNPRTLAKSPPELKLL